MPKTLKAERHLSNFKYRDAVLDMHITGFGNTLKSFKLDGVEADPFFPANLKGQHTIEMVLDNRQPAPMQMVMRENAYQPLTPVARTEGGNISWQEVPEAIEYIVLRNGKEMTRTTELNAPLQGDGEYAVVAVNADGWHSYMSEPIGCYSQATLYEVERFALPFDPNRKAVQESVGAGGGVAGKAEARPEVPTLKGIDTSGASGHVAMITRNENIFITIPIAVEEDGTYAIDWRYANGNGPINTDNKCATRVLKVDGKDVGVSVFPHRGTDEWNNWGWSNACVVELTKGRHVVTLQFCDTVENMNIYVNQALLDQMRLTRI